MYQIIGYYKGPERHKNLFERLFGGQGSIVYLVNPQLYREGNPHLLHDFGVYPINFCSVQPTQANLETRLTTELQNALKGEIEVPSSTGKITIPLDEIKIKIEKSQE